MDWLEIREKEYLQDIKLDKKLVMIMSGVTYLNLFVALLNIFIIYYQDHISLFTTMCTGAMIANLIWCFGQLFCLKQDLNYSKECLNRVKELQEKKESKDVEYKDVISRLSAQHK
jgi:hypothetical protein